MCYDSDPIATESVRDTFCHLFTVLCRVSADVSQHNTLCEDTLSAVEKSRAGVIVLAAAGCPPVNLLCLTARYVLLCWYVQC